MSNYNNFSTVFESMYEAIAASKKKVLNIEYLNLSGGGIFTFDWVIDDDYDIDDLIDEVLMIIRNFNANHIRIFDPETKETVYEVACLCGGTAELNVLIDQGILEDPNIPEYFKEFIPLKLKFIELINTDLVRIAELYKTREECKKNKISNPFNASSDYFAAGMILSALLSVQEILASKVEGAIFTNEEYEYYIKDGFPSWLIFDVHCDNQAFVDEFPEEYITVEKHFYTTAKAHLDLLADCEDLDEDEDFDDNYDEDDDFDYDDDCDEDDDEDDDEELERDDL